MIDKCIRLLIKLNISDANACENKQSSTMTKYAMLSFRSEEDFKICNEAMGIKASDTAVTSFDGMLTVLIKTEKLFPPGTLMVTANNGQRIFVRVMSGTEQAIT